MVLGKEEREDLALKHVIEFVNHAKELIEGIKLEHLIEEGALTPT